MKIFKKLLLISVLMMPCIMIGADDVLDIAAMKSADAAKRIEQSSDLKTAVNENVQKAKWSLLKMAWNYPGYTASLGLFGVGAAVSGTGAFLAATTSTKALIACSGGFFGTIWYRLFATQGDRHKQVMDRFDGVNKTLADMTGQLNEMQSQMSTANDGIARIQIELPQIESRLREAFVSGNAALLRDMEARVLEIQTTLALQIQAAEKRREESEEGARKLAEERHGQQVAEIRIVAGAVEAQGDRVDTVVAAVDNLRTVVNNNHAAAAAQQGRQHQEVVAAVDENRKEVASLHEQLRRMASQNDRNAFLLRDHTKQLAVQNCHVQALLMQNGVQQNVLNAILPAGTQILLVAPDGRGASLNNLMRTAAVGDHMRLQNPDLETLVGPSDLLNSMNMQHTRGMITNAYNGKTRASSTNNNQVLTRRYSQPLLGYMPRISLQNGDCKRQ